MTTSKTKAGKASSQDKKSGSNVPVAAIAAGAAIGSAAIAAAVMFATRSKPAAEKAPKTPTGKSPTESD